MRVDPNPTRRRIAVPAALISGVLGALAFPEPDIAPLAIVALAGLVKVSSGAGGRRGFALGFVFGIGFFGVLIYWISIIGVIAYVALVLLQAVFIGLFGAVWGATSERVRHVALYLLGPAVFWVAIVEYLRSVFPVRGFTWGQLAQSQHNVPHLLRVTGLGGSWLLAALLVAAASCIALAIAFAGNRKWKGALVSVALVVALLVVPMGLPSASADGEQVRVAIVQGNVPRNVPPSFEKELAILHSHVDMTESLDEEVDLVVWPESAVGIDPEREPFIAEEIGNAARAANAPMIVGGNLDLPNDRYMVMAFLVSAQGEFIDRYQKTHLVPFGEYVPARRYLDWIPALDQVPRDAVAAAEKVIFDLPFGRVAPVISFEGDFGSLVRSRIAAGGRILVVATNTSTWEESWASAQHLAMSQVRAAENGVYVIHGALSGISAFVDPTGRTIARSELWEATSLVSDLGLATRVTLYARMGDWFALFCVGLTILWLLMGALSRRRRDTVP